MISSRNRFLFDDDNTILLFDWYNVVTSSKINDESEIESLGVSKKKGVFHRTTNSYQTDGSIYFGYNGYLQVCV